MVDARGSWTKVAAALAERGVPSDAHVPFDARVWLVLDRAPGEGGAAR